jgi:hypothetical protein
MADVVQALPNRSISSRQQQRICAGGQIERNSDILPHQHTLGKDVVLSVLKGM